MAGEIWASLVEALDAVEFAFCCFEGVRCFEIEISKL